MLKGYRTIIIGAALAVLGFLQSQDLTAIISNPQTAGYVVSGIGVVMMVLRKMTDTPLGKK
jgi:hypothetical protein